MRSTLLAMAVLSLLGAGPGAGSGAVRSDLERIRANDNRRAAGVLHDGVLTLHLERRRCSSWSRTRLTTARPTASSSSTRSRTAAGAG